MHSPHHSAERERSVLRMAPRGHTTRVRLRNAAHARGPSETFNKSWTRTCGVWALPSIFTYFLIVYWVPAPWARHVSHLCSVLLPPALLTPQPQEWDNRRDTDTRHFRP